MCFMIWLFILPFLIVWNSQLFHRHLYGIVCCCRERNTSICELTTCAAKSWQLSYALPHILHSHRLSTKFAISIGRGNFSTIFPAFSAGFVTVFMSNAVFLHLTGKDGRIFHCLNIQTWVFMKKYLKRRIYWADSDCEENWAEFEKIRNDSRRYLLKGNSWKWEPK